MSSPRRKPRTLDEIRAACRRHGVAARLMRGLDVVGWVDAAGLFRAGGTQLEPRTVE